jgi:predicted SprT family Zn-dependent metalloprotease
MKENPKTIERGSQMNFSTKAQEEISTVLAEEIDELIIAGEIKDQQGIENSIREMLKEVGAQTYQKVLEKEDSKNGKGVRCECGGKAKRISKREAKVMTVFGWVSYRRSYYGCSRCGKKQSRLDKEWGINPGEVSPVLGKLLAIAGVDIAFERARRKIKEFLLVEVSDNTIRKQTQLMGQKQALLETKWIQSSQDEAWLQSRERTIESVPERLYGSMDGAQVPIGEEWRELKSLSWYRVDTVYGQEQHKAQEISYHCEIAPAQDFGRLLWATGLKRLADKAKELIFVCDGAIWIWKLVSHYFPDAIQIVDWYHACEYLTPIADAVFSQDAERQNWLQKVKDWLWYGKTQKVIQACQRYIYHHLAAEAAQRAVTYYSNNQHRMDYAEFRKKNYWIGSGTIESACKQIATARLKIAGARWAISGAIATAKARAAWLSDGDCFSILSCLP